MELLRNGRQANAVRRPRFRCDLWMQGEENQMSKPIDQEREEVARVLCGRCREAGGQCIDQVNPCHVKRTVKRGSAK